MKIQKTMLRFTFSLVFLFALFAKSYGQQCDLVYGRVFGYIPCAAGQGTNTGSYQMFIAETTCSCSGPWTYEVFQSQGIGSSTPSGPAVFSSPSPVWNTSSEVWNLPVGNYVARISNVNGVCASTNNNNGSSSSIFPFSFSEPDPINIAYTCTQSPCTGLSNGSINVNVNGGTPGYTYLWSGPNGFTSPTQDLSNLAPGTYCVTVTDMNGCSDSACCQINPPPPLLTITETHIDPLCHDDANGSVTVTFNGGTPGYTITGIGAPVIIPPGQNSNTFSNLAAGTYFITITDAYGCTASLEPFDITAPQSLTLTGVVSGNDIDVTASGGTPNYVYSWSNGSGLEDQQDLISGIYILIVTDTNGCQVADTFDVNNASLYENSNESLLLFPNPSAEFLNIHISPSMENNRFVVFDCLGRTVGSGILESKETIISVKHLANGIYHFQTETQRVQFVVAH